MQTSEHLYALLLAGGKENLFWPLSREDHPKQLLTLFSERSLIEDTYERIRPLVAPRRVLVATSQALVLRLIQLLPDVPRSNFLVEPTPKNTAPSIALATLRCLREDPEGILVALPSDHFVADNDAFLEAVVCALPHAKAGKLVAIGVTPTNAITTYGYIKFGEFTEPEEPSPRYRARYIKDFIEKPDRERAVSFLRAGRYLWNSGVFVFKAQAMRQAMETCLPGLLDQVAKFLEISDGGASEDELQEVWSKVQDISIDYGVMERARDLVVVPASFGWSDVGSWDALQAFPTDDQENFTHGTVCQVDSSRNVLFCTHGLLATLGVKDMVVVVTKRAVLVCSMSRAQDMGKVEEALRERNLLEYL